MTERSDGDSTTPGAMKRKKSSAEEQEGESVSGAADGGAEAPAAVKKMMPSTNVEENKNPTTTDSAHPHQHHRQPELLVDGPFSGCLVERSDAKHNQASVIIALDTSSQLDRQRWENVMPSMIDQMQFQFLERLCIVNSRYIRHLHESVSSLQHLRELCLVNCTSLVEITPAISVLHRLEVVRQDTMVDL
jgi:hypothetical protein